VGRETLESFESAYFSEMADVRQRSSHRGLVRVKMKDWLGQ